MAEQKVVAGRVEVTTGNSNANLKELNKNLKDTKGSLQETSNAAATTGKNIESSSGNFQNLKNSIGSLPGPLGQAIGGVQSLSTAFKALLANPVGLVITALVLALTALYKIFTNTFEGGQKVEQVFAGIKAAAQSLFDNIGKIGSAIVKFFSFDFSGAVAEIQGVANAATDAYNKMAALTAEAQKLKQEQLQNDLEGAERAKKLAILREQASDDSVPAAERKKVLQELKKESEENAKSDIDLAKRVAENKIAQLTLEKDGALKNAEEINKIRIEQINGETENANELRRINKQITAVEKEEQAKRKEEAAKAAEASKEARARLIEFNAKLLKIQQENELAIMKDGYDKELKQLAFRIADEKRQLELQFQDRKITLAQKQQLEAELSEQAHIKRKELIEKQYKDQQDKEVAFQKELNAIKQKTVIDGIKDVRQRERLELQIGFEEKLKDAITRYKDDQDRLLEVQAALREQYQQEVRKMDEKYKAEDEKKEFEKRQADIKKVFDDKKSTYEQRLEAIADEQALFQLALDRKLISEQEYNAKTAELTEARKNLATAEMEHKLGTLGKIGDAFGTLSELVGKQTAAGKAFAVAQATIATIQSAVSSYNSLAGIPIVGPVLGGIAAAGAIASGVANVKKILAVQVPGQGSAGGGSSSISATSPTAPIAPTQTGTSIDQKSLAEIGNAAAGGVNRSIRAFVLDSDVQQNQDRNARLNRAARLGG